MPGYTGPYPDEWINAYNTQTPDVQAAMRETYTGKSPTEISASFTGAAGAAGSDPTYQNLQGSGFGTLPASWPQSLPSAPAPAPTPPTAPPAPAQPYTGTYPQEWVNTYNQQSPGTQAAMQQRFGGQSPEQIVQDWNTNIAPQSAPGANWQSVLGGTANPASGGVYPQEWLNAFSLAPAPTQAALSNRYTGASPQQIAQDWATNIQPAYRTGTAPSDILAGKGIYAPNVQTYTGPPAQYSTVVNGNNDPNSPYDPMNQAPLPTLGPNQFFAGGAPPASLPTPAVGQPGGPPAPVAPAPPATQPPANYANTISTVLPFLSQILAQAQPASGVTNPNATLIQNVITALDPAGRRRHR